MLVECSQFIVRRVPAVEHWINDYKRWRDWNAQLWAPRADVDWFMLRGAGRASKGVVTKETGAVQGSDLETVAGWRNVIEEIQFAEVKS